jgi:hypothetical protein
VASRYNIRYKHFVSIPTEEIPEVASVHEVVELLASKSIPPIPIVRPLPDELHQRVRVSIRPEVYFGEAIDIIKSIVDEYGMDAWLENGGLCIGIPPSPASPEKRPDVGDLERGRRIDECYKELVTLGKMCKGKNNTSAEFCRKELCPELKIWKEIENSRMMTPEILENFFEYRRPDMATNLQRYAFIGTMFQLKAWATRKLREKYLKAARIQGRPRGRAARKL